MGMMGALGNIQALQKYWPYGAVRSSTTITQTDKLFTGQRQEPADPAGLGLYDYRARFYSTLVGRFVSADTITKDGLNRYAYVRDNPLRFVDPSGNCFTTLDGHDLPCTEADALKWIACAMGIGCSGDLQKFARGGVGENQFWGNVFRLTYDPVVEMRVLNVIAVAAVRGQNIDVIPASGWGALGGHEGVGGSFFKASFLDLILGGNRVQALAPDDIVGAYNWWGNTEILNYAESWKDRLGVPWDTEAEYGYYWNATVAAAQYFAPLPCGDVGYCVGGGYKALEWSADQRQLLNGSGFSVDPTPIDVRRIIGEQIAECMSKMLQGCFDTPFPLW